MTSLCSISRQSRGDHRLEPRRGRAIAERMADHGAKVVVSSRKLDACEEVVKAIKDKGGEAISLTCNINRKERSAEAGRRHHQTLGRHRRAGV